MSAIARLATNVMNSVAASSVGAGVQTVAFLRETAGSYNTQTGLDDPGTTQNVSGRAAFDDRAGAKDIFGDGLGGATDRVLWMIELTDAAGVTVAPKEGETLVVGGNDFVCTTNALNYQNVNAIFVCLVREL